MNVTHLKNRLKTFAALLAAITLFTLVESCKKETTLYNSSFTKNDSIKSLHVLMATSASLPAPNTYDLTMSLPKGYVKDGSKDYTIYLQDAINTYPNITFPPFPILVNDNGLLVGSNKTLNFLTGSEIHLKPTSSTNYNIFRISKSSNVTFNNPVIVGDRYEHLGNNGGEWGQGIGLYGATNVTINGAHITNCWGDGIYLASKDKIPNRNIVITNAYCRANRRNGFSITSVIGLVLESPYAGYSDGTLPSSGIDFEAGSYNDEFQNIVINNARTEYNQGNGILLSFRSLFGGPNKKISFQINKHTDKGSRVSLKTSAILTRRVANETVTGSLNITNPFWRKNTLSPIQANLLVKTIELKITKPVVQDINGKPLSDNDVLSLLTYKTNINTDANFIISF